MKGRRKYIILTLGLIGAGAIFWLLINIFEAEKPQIRVKALPEFISSQKKILLIASDKKMGLREIKAELVQGKKKAVLFKQKFALKGLLNKKGVHEFSKIIQLDPVRDGFSDGKAVLRVWARDWSRKKMGKGNTAVFKKEIIIDTTSPTVVPLSRLNYFSVGGSGLIVFEVSEDTVKSGIYINQLFFPSYPLANSKKYRVCYIAIPYNIKLPVDMFIWAEDRAGNVSTVRFYYKIKRKKFRKDNVIITDRFLKKILPFFSYYKFDPKDSDIEKFLKINRKLRKENDQFIKSLLKNTSKKRLWSGSWVSLKNAKCTARFADHRFYFYKGKLIDQEDHLGIDLASIANAPIPASNSGTVIYTGRLGIYGLSVIIDHGQGIFSLYGHMGKIEVSKGQYVKKGDIIGITDQTGLAGGDHLHLSILINGIFVNPEEWLDYHWLRDNIIRKLKIAGGY